MINVEIVPLTQENKRVAQKIAVEANVGTPLRIIRFFNKSLRKKENNIFVAAADNHVVGVTGWYQDDGHWAGKSLGNLFPYGEDIYWVSFFAVQESLRSQGIGSQLMSYLIKTIKHKNIREFWVYTSRAKIFYEKMGFTFVTRAVIESKPHDFLKYKVFYFSQKDKKV